MLVNVVSLRFHCTMDLVERKPECIENPIRHCCSIRSVGIGPLDQLLPLGCMFVISAFVDREIAERYGVGHFVGLLMSDDTGRFDLFHLSLRVGGRTLGCPPCEGITRVTQLVAANHW